jgi:hypothetical protein
MKGRTIWIILAGVIALHGVGLWLLSRVEVPEMPAVQILGHETLGVEVKIQNPPPPARFVVSEGRNPDTGRTETWYQVSTELATPPSTP